MKNTIGYPPSNFNPRLIFIIIAIVTFALVMLFFGGCSSSKHMPKSYIKVYNYDHPEQANNLNIKMPKAPKTPHYKYHHYYQPK